MLMLICQLFYATFRVQHLMREQEAAFERYQAALDAFVQARKTHHD